LHVALAYPKWNLDFPPSRRSAALEVIGYEHARRLAKEATVTLYRPGRLTEPKQAVHEGVTYRRVANTLDRGLSYGQRLKEKLLKTTGFFDPARPWTSSRLSHAGYGIAVGLDSRAKECDIVHLSIYHHLAPVLSRLNPESKLILNVHDHSQMQRDHIRVRRDLQRFDLIVGVSRFLTDNIIQTYPEVSDRCITIHDAVDVDHFTDEPVERGRDRPLILFVGRTSPEKGVHRLLDAFAVVSRKVPEAQLVLVGSRSLAGEEFVDPEGTDPLFSDVRGFWGKPAAFRDYLLEKSAEIPGEVTFVGPVEHTELVEWYRRADIFVFPSLWHEPFGMPPIEAMSSGLPVVATTGGALPEIVVDGETGLLVDRGDVEALAQALLELLGDPARGAGMGGAGRARARKHFSWERHTGDWMNAYRRVLGSG
jgi:glycosyltransferase involved in cell wall biosynthesis